MILDERIASSTVKITELPLCNLYLQNEARFPWLVLVPRLDAVTELIDLSDDDQQQVMREIATVSRIVKRLFNADKLNVANLGNVVAQLHIHVVARFADDLAWPDPIWGKFSAPQPYNDADAQVIIANVKALLAQEVL